MTLRDDSDWGGPLRFDGDSWEDFPEDTHDPRTHWKQRDGSLIAISEMGDRHLYHALRMVWRNVGEVRAGLQQEWRRRGKPENGWQDDDAPERSASE